ncbi:MAG: c-type cytochrome [Nitrospinota bacterium]|nr:c-type cytochrome [Nitrospinota bacterium]
MNGNVVRLFLALAITISLAAPDIAATATTSVEEDYTKFCAPCHRQDRLGFTGPPLIPGHFSKTNENQLTDVIAEGLPATQMPPFREVLPAEKIAALAKYIQTPVGKVEWTNIDMAQSRKEVVVEYAPRAKRIQDLQEVIMVVERGTRKLAVLSGNPPRVFASYYVGAVHGGLKFTHNLGRVFSIARDGKVTSFDLRSLRGEIQMKVGVSSRAIAISKDDNFIAVANNLPSNVVLFTSDMTPAHEIKIDGTVGGIYGLYEDNSFLLTFRDKSEIWLIEAKPPFAIKKIKTPEPFEDISISPRKNLMIAARRDGEKMYVFDYRTQKTLATFPAGGFPHLASAVFFAKGGELFAALNHIKKAEVTIISIDKLKVVSRVPIEGAGFFVRTHSFTPYIWAGTNSEKIALIDKADFKTVKYITPLPGHKTEHVEFNARGNFALISIPEVNGSVMIFHSQTLAPVTSIPFNTPKGKYNSMNKTFPDHAFDGDQGAIPAPAPSSSWAPPARKLASHGAKGQFIYQESCMGCHHQKFDAFGPSFAEIASIRSRDQIRSHIQAPSSMFKTLGYRRNSMPTIPLSEEQLDAVTEYIISFKE